MKDRTYFYGIALFVSAALAPAALAQPPAAPPPEPPPEQPPPPEAERFQPTWTVSLGIGLVEFAGEEADSVTDIGASYDVRVLYAPHTLLDLEAAYIGTSQNITTLGLESDAKLRSNGVEALAKFDLGQYLSADLGALRFAPFVFAGFAYQRFNLSNEGVNTSDVADSDNVIAIPLGAGVGATWRNILGEARFTWRSTFDEDLFRDPSGARADESLSHWTLMARAGLGF